MNIEKELNELQRQIDILKSKQNESNDIDDIELTGGEVFLSIFKNKAIVFNIEGYCGIVYEDGVGRSYSTKEKLKSYLKKEGFTFHSKTCKFI